MYISHLYWYILFPFFSEGFIQVFCSIFYWNVIFFLIYMISSQFLEYINHISVVYCLIFSSIPWLTFFLLLMVYLMKSSKFYHNPVYFSFSLWLVLIVYCIRSLCLPQRHTFLCYLLEMLLFHLLYTDLQSSGIFTYCVR